MAYVVTEICINCKYTACVDVCPVNCFHEGPNSLVIDPEECISCQLCEPECPVTAIFEEDDVPKKYGTSIKLNVELSKIWPVIDETKPPMPEAERWKSIDGKLKYLKK